ncbi:A/G-specific adenine glycosylase [Patescibacteria group bacterium]|nr:A/G-specific adenine glycosylase [Patescibacteria group bacterium]
MRILQIKKFKEFKAEVWNYYRGHKRDLPWRRTKNPYRILVSEIMLQQTQVSRALIKYPQFIKRFPNFQALATASIKDVLKEWQGLGYNRRALALKRAAEIVVEKHRGELPRDLASLEALPGIGQSTAGAITAFSYGIAEPFIETNIRRAYIHFFFQRKEKVHDKEILKLVTKTIDKKNPREWYWALMDYGAMLGALPKNPNQKSVHYAKQSRFVGSDRELRGKILKLLLAKKFISENLMEKYPFVAPSQNIFQDRRRCKRVLRSLLRDHLICRKDGKIGISE